MAEAGRTGPRAVWAIPAWRLAFPAAVISRLGDLVFDITVVLWISTDLAAGRSWAPLAVSGVLLAAVAPVLLVSANSILSVAGPPLAAPLLFTAGVTWALAINALSFLASSILLGRTAWDSAPEPAAAREGFWQALNEGRKAIAANRVLLSIVVSATMVVLAMGAITVLEVFFVTTVLHDRASLLGILLGGYAVGTLLGAVAAPRLERRAGTPALYVWGLIVAGLATVAFSRTTSFAPAVVLYVVAGIPIGVINTVMSPLSLRTIPPDQLGRAVAFLNIFPTVAQLIATALAGWLVSSVLRGLHVTVAGMTFGPVDTVFTAGGLVILATGIAVWRPIFSARAQAEPVPSAQ